MFVFSRLCYHTHINEFVPYLYFVPAVRSVRGLHVQIFKSTPTPSNNTDILQFYQIILNKIVLTMEIVIN